LLFSFFVLNSYFKAEILKAELKAIQEQEAPKEEKIVEPVPQPIVSEAEKVVEPVVEKVAEEEQAKPVRWGDEIQVLKGMGFQLQESVFVDILDHHKGNLERAVQDLI
jgi:hypothetical protein